MTASLLLGTAIAGLRIAAPSVGQVVSPQDGAILRFVDCKTQQKVVLVGSMHYNPRSIQLAAEAVRAEAEAGTLRSVVVESCPTRWNNTMKNQPKGTFLRSLFDNEMQAAAEVAEECGCPVALGDQAIEDTARRMAQLTGATMVEVLTPFSGDDLRAGVGQLAAPRSNGVSLLTLLQPELLLGTPIALFRYPTSIAIKSPAIFALLVAVIALGLAYPADPSLVDGAGDEIYLELVEALAFAVLETIFLGRVFLVGLLEERNYVLARNIRRAATARAESGTGKPGSIRRSGRTVVAILGMAHLNGVRQILTTSRVV
eukprot:scaffold227450_cov30-Tisochrysis_lutea.AAC.1